MKKQMIIAASLCVALALTGCKSSESAYRKAYEKAQAVQQVVEEPEVTTVVTPVVEVPVTQTATTDNNDNVNVRSEQVNVISGAGLKPFSVVVGSFSVLANAQGVQNKLNNAGYNAQIVQNSSKMYRVVATTFDTKSEAVRSRDDLRTQYKDAWLLYSK